MNHFVKAPSSFSSFPLTLSKWRAGIVAAQSKVVLPSPLPVWSDTDLLDRLVAGEPDALGHIYDRYAASLYRLLNALLNSPIDAEDALQEVFVALATGRVDKIRDLKPYLFVAARHQAFTVLRRRKREQGYEDIALVEIAVHDRDMSGGEANRDWTELLARLPLEQREVIALKVWEEMTFADIALVVRASPNTVMSRYRYGIERLRKWVQEEERE